MPEKPSEAPVPKPTAFLYEEGDGIARVTLNRPDRLNALTFETYEQLTATFRAIAKRPSVRAVLLAGAGRAFCSGGDHEAIIKPLLDEDAGRHLEFTRLTCDLILSIRKVPVPVIAALHGAVVGAGAVMAAASDIRVAADNTKVGFVFVKVGLSGADMGAAWLLPRIVGLGTATRWLMTGDLVDADRARKAGFLTEVVPLANFPARADHWARRMAAGPGRSLAVTKEQLNRECGLDLETAMGEEARVQAELMGGSDFREGYAAFRDRREPKFGGLDRK
ncbi:MAG TPA: enoyl-CoA hydratase-related protein [Candidatus Saccharimonadales bacterium]|nr:enoyl-CoA hydratase-related protein [Candidatus Saccharimonadales bacterium]